MAYSPSFKTHKLYFLIQIILRILAIGTTVAAASLMFTNNQTTVAFGVEVEARYSYTPAFKFFAIANTVALALSILTLGFTFIMGRKAVDPTYYFLLFLHDLIITVVLMGGFAAAAAIGYLGKYGNFHSGWMPVCDHFGKFCHRGIASLILGFLGFIFYFILTVVSANKSTQLNEAN